MKLSKVYRHWSFPDLFVATCYSGLQTPERHSAERQYDSDATAPPQLLQALDRLSNKNRQLEKQNRR